MPVNAVITVKGRFSRILSDGASEPHLERKPPTHNGLLEVQAHVGQPSPGALGVPMLVDEIQCISIDQSFREVHMATTSMVHVRVDDKVKEQATEALAAMGLSVSDAVRVFLIRVAAEKQLPFAIKVPNAVTQSAMVEADGMVRAHRARFGSVGELLDDIEKNSRK